jgi:ribosomal protein L37E
VITIEDLKSSQGTLVNGQKVISAELKDGDEIALGDTRLRFEPTPDAVGTMMVDDSVKMAMIACKSCGTDVPVDKKFCQHCGYPLHEPIVQQTPVVSKPKPSPPKSSAMPSVTPQATPPIYHHPPVLEETDAREGRRWLPFILGLGIPLILGVVGIVTLSALGVFDEPADLPALDQGQADSIELPAEEVIIASPEGIPFTFRAYDPTMDIGLPTQFDLAIYYDPSDDIEYSHSIPLVVGQEIILENVYCGTSETILEDISKSINITFEIDGAPIPVEDLHTEKLLRDTRACYVYRGVFTGMTPGEHHLVETMSAVEQINDGWETWGPEDLVIQALIRVEGEALETLDPTDSSAEASQPDEPTVTLHIGDARMLTTPPEVIAYANTQVSPAPSEITIDEGCGEDCLRYFEWMGITKANQWIEGSATVSTTAIGVQLWSDATGGFARVYLDGEEVWSGDTRGEDNQWPGGAFVRYLEISGLPDTTHSLLVESLGEGGSVTLYFFGIGEVVP